MNLEDAYDPSLKTKNRETHVKKKLGFELGMDIGLLDL